MSDIASKFVLDVNTDDLAEAASASNPYPQSDVAKRDGRRKARRQIEAAGTGAPSDSTAFRQIARPPWNPTIGIGEPKTHRFRKETSKGDEASAFTQCPGCGIHGKQFHPCHPPAPRCAPPAAVETRWQFRKCFRVSVHKTGSYGKITAGSHALSTSGQEGRRCPSCA